MPVRDAQAVARAARSPYAGYAIRRSFPLAPDVDRIAACIALLATMLISGVALGSSRRT